MTIYDYWASFWAKVTPEDSIMRTTFVPVRSTYDPNTDIPDLTGKVALVTGGASGLGYASTKQLLLKNAKVYIAGRDTAKLTAAVESLTEETGKAPLMVRLDLEDLAQVRECAVDFLKREAQLDLLFCNAGVMGPPPELVTQHGYDLQFGANVIGHYLLQTLLLPALRASAQAGGPRARVVHSTSHAHFLAPAPGIAFETLHAGEARDTELKKWGSLTATWTLYGQSKLGNILVANLFDRECGSEVVSCSAHPGYIQTALHRHETFLHSIFTRLIEWPVEDGVKAMLCAATSKEGDEFGGKYLIPFGRLGRPDKHAGDVELQDELKAWLEKELKEYL